MPGKVEESNSVVHERIAIGSGDRQLEGVLAYPLENEPCFAALVAGPHPFMGGDLDNNLVSSLMDELPRHGGIALTFNYAGVGASRGGPPDWATAMSQFWQEGSIPCESQWVNDTEVAWRTLCGMADVPRVIVGYSFGCWAAARCGMGDECRVLISPNVRKHDLDALKGGGGALLVLCSDNDFTCTTDEVATWFDGLREPKSLEVLEAGEHFFRGHEDDVLNRVVAHLRRADVVGGDHAR